ncbi:MAG: DUF3108 domain-containing protein [Gammaproteobacteria bacterium]|nr:DUF3108 domain-containing protein [Gammaproteobacteria bacterium]
MKRRQFLKLGLSGLVLARVRPLAAWPLDQGGSILQLRYRVSERGTALGEATIDYRVDGDRYEIKSHVVPKGRAALLFSVEMNEVSRGCWLDGEPRPLTYSYQRTGLKSLERHYQFDYEAGQVRVSDRAPLPLELGVQDEPSHLVKLSQALQAGAETSSFQVLHGSKAQIYDYRFVAGPVEPLTLAGRQWQARLISRETSRGKYDMTLWCAPELGYLPIRQVRIHREKKTRSELELIGWKAD